ncbi:MAG: glycoside hydrolase domain-containing protein [Ilumatobacteraceae bacterium]
MAVTVIHRGARGIDFLGGVPPSPFPAIDKLRAKGITFVATYLKNHRASYIDQLHAAGISWVPLFEKDKQRMFAGAAAGEQDAREAVAACRKFNVPDGVPIVFSHDTNTMDQAVIDYNVTAAPIVQSLGYGYGGYGGRFFFERCQAAGVSFDVIWSMAGTAILGGRAHDAHAWQGRYEVDGSDEGIHDIIDITVDKDVCQRAFNAWGPSMVTTMTTTNRLPAAQAPIPKEEDMMPIVTNSEQLQDSPPFVTRFVIMDDGTLRALEEQEWIVRGSPEGFHWTNQQIAVAGFWEPPPPSQVPVVNRGLPKIVKAPNLDP